jgi:hypothetical protein
MTVRIRELEKGDFCRIDPEARAVHALRGIDPCMDRVFGAFVGSRLVGMVRVKQMAEGYTVDRVSMADDCRKTRLARSMMEHMIAGLGDRLLWISAGKDLVILCWTMGVRPVAERTLPPGVRKFLSCPKSMKCCGFVPMVRMPQQESGPVSPRPPHADIPKPRSSSFSMRRVFLD